MNEHEILARAYNALSYSRVRGMPYYEYSMDEKQAIFNKIVKASKYELLIGDEITQNLAGIGLAWSYFRHHWGVKVGKMKTPIDVFNNDELLLKALLSRMKWGGNTNVEECGVTSDAQIRKAIRTASGAQAVSNFRPATAAGIYRKFGGGVVWDMSCGFGGRLLGAYASGIVTKYIGTDPSTPTFNGLLNIAKEFSHLPMQVRLIKLGSEAYLPPEQVDICFTSPPYFDTEVYSDEFTQSCNKFLTVDDWNDGFLKQTMQNCFDCLKDTGVMILNVANVKSHIYLEADTVRLAMEIGFSLDSVLRLRLSSMNNGGFKHEPVFVFRKRVM